ncbi:MAG TPA: hypothetical protein VHY57_08960 [Rhizomicrobium sp.]|jgi:hypothetical protein|nr:hypothetical protein [Rhizomicrobium sp.]
MKLAICLATSLALCASSAIANPALAPGKPAGVHKAQGLDTNTTLIIAGVGLAAAGIAIAASAGNAAGPTTSTNSTSSTSSTSTTS